MQSNIDFICDLCGQSNIAYDYVPVNTKRGSHVLVCANCGLTQSVSTRHVKPWLRTLSCDADWGNVRHAKGLRLKVLAPIIEKNFSFNQKIKILDIGSNRGDFVHWVTGKYPHAQIIAIEPDASIVANYKDLKQVDLINKKLEQCDLPKDSIDFAYCSHTLEHASSATDMLHTIRSLLRPNGSMFLEVPDLEGIKDNNIVEEFFIDKHVFHFDRSTLFNLLESIGFRIIDQGNKEDSLNISLFLCKSNVIKKGFILSETVANNVKMIEDYQNRLLQNRTLLRKLVDSKLIPLANRQKVAYWGAGRIFDALIRYGKLPLDSVCAVVDTHLWKYFPITHGISIERPEKLRMIEPNVCVVLARSSKEFIADRAYRLGIRHVIIFDELMEQCRLQ